MTYAEILPIGTALATCAASFGLGVIYANLPYDYHTLWLPDRDAVARSVAHYATWANAPRKVHYILHGVMFLGLCGCFIRMFKPHPEAKYFEWGTLGAMMVAIMVYFTNLRIGVNSCVTGIWGDVDEFTGINVMAASQFIMAVALVGVFVLQGGLYYAQWYEKKIQDEFYRNEREAEISAKKAEDAEKTETKESADNVQKAENAQDSATASGAKPKSKTSKRRA